MKRFRWIDLALVPFGLCVLFLLLLGKLCGLTYKQISVVFNLWFQGALLTLSGVAPATSAIYKLCTGCSVWWLAAAIVLTVYATVYVFGFIQMLRHYHLPFDDAFDLCVQDLEQLATRWKTTYQAINLIIFVLFFLLLIGLNFLITYFVLHT